VLAALYTGSGCGGAINETAYVQVGVCINIIPTVGVMITLNGNSGTVAAYTGANSLLCTGTPTNTAFTIGSCFTFPVTGVSSNIVSSSTQLWAVAQSTVNSAPTCSSSPSATVATLLPVTALSACAAQACTCSYGTCTSVSCQTSAPSASGLVVSTYNDSKCQNLVGIASYNVQGCAVTINATVTPFVTATSENYVCSGNTVSTNIYVGNTACSGTPTTTANITGGCTQLATLWFQIGCGATCFHKDTEILYKDEILTLDSLKKGEHPSCTVPHIYTSAGVKLMTSCNNATLRLSIEHLVYTQRGLIEAQEVKVGDLLFQDLQETRTCRVLSAEKENSLSESYFGLNCEESVVLANGFKTSTFGKLHFLPSLWMRIMSPLIGVRAASAWGDYFSHLVQRYKLF